MIRLRSGYGVTVTNADAMTAVLGGLGANGVLMVISEVGPSAPPLDAKKMAA